METLISNVKEIIRRNKVHLESLCNERNDCKNQFDKANEAVVLQEIEISKLECELEIVQKQFSSTNSEYFPPLHNTNADNKSTIR